MPDRFTTTFVNAAIATLQANKSKKEALYTDRLETGKSLLVRLSYGGRVTWKCLYYLKEGKKLKPRATKLGTYPKMTPKAAYAAARAFDHQQAQVSTQHAVTFAKVSQQWFDEKVLGRGLRSAGEIRRHLDSYVLPYWADLNIHEIRLTQVNELLDRIANKQVERRTVNGRKQLIGGKSQADAVLATVRAVLIWYKSRNEHFNCPVDFRLDLKRDHRAAEEKQRDRVLNDDEIRSLWKACAQLGNQGALIQLLLLTGQRLRKVANLKWTDIENGTWTIGTRRREKGNAGVLVLPQIARDLIEQQLVVSGNGYMFPAARGDGPINSFAQLKRELDRKLPKTMQHWVLHDLRRTARTRLAELGIEDRLAELVLGHKIAGIEGIYNRAKLTEKKAEALRLLAAHIQHLIDPTPTKNNVVPLRERHAAEQRA